MQLTCTIGSLFSGIGGLDLGVEQALATRKIQSSVVFQVEKDPYARAVLQRHWPHARRYDDILGFTEAPKVRLLCGGPPCQDISNAGERAGIFGERSGLWFEMVRGVRLLRPDVFVENVAELLAYLGHVLGPLAELGYDAEWGVFSAAEVGAPHLRERTFVLAYAKGFRFGQWQGRESSSAEGQGCPAEERRRSARPCSGELLADAYEFRRDQRARDLAEAPGRDEPADSGDAPNTAGLGREERLVHGHESQVTTAARLGGQWTLGQLSDGASRGWFGRFGSGNKPPRAGWWGAEPPVGRVAHGSTSRLDARRRRASLRCLGNGVVPQQACEAFLRLAERAGL